MTEETRSQEYAALKLIIETKLDNLEVKVDELKSEQKERDKEAKSENKDLRDQIVKLQLRQAELNTRLMITYGFLSAVILGLVGVAVKVMSGGI